MLSKLSRTQKTYLTLANLDWTLTDLIKTIQQHKPPNPNPIGPKQLELNLNIILYLNINLIKINKYNTNY